MADATPSRHAFTVLIVDHSQLVRRMLVEWLEGLGYHTLSASGGLEAVELYRQHSQEIAAVLMNRHMPGFDGERTLEALRTITPGLKCCFLTRESDPTVLAAMRDLAGCPPLREPFILPEVELRLALLLEGGPAGG